MFYNAFIIFFAMHFSCGVCCVPLINVVPVSFSSLFFFNYMDSAAVRLYCACAVSHVAQCSLHFVVVPLAKCVHLCDRVNNSAQKTL